MTPRQFVGEYGTPIPLTYNLDPGQVLVIPADPDRYLIVFWSTDGQVEVRFGEDPEQQTVAWQWAPGGAPVSFDHAHTASLCGAAFTVGPLVVPAAGEAGPTVSPPEFVVGPLGSPGSFTLLVGRMSRIGKRPTAPEKYRGNAKRKSMGNRDGRQRPDGHTG